MKDLNLQVTRLMPGADATVTSSDIDLGATSTRGGAGTAAKDAELVIEIPALTSTHLPNATTLTVTVQSGDSAAPTTSTNMVKVITGTGSTIAAQDVKFGLPSNVGRYVNVKFVAAGGTGTQVALTATISLRVKLYR